MQVIRDLLGGSKPQTIELPYNGSLAVDGVTLRYKGSLAKFMDYDDIDHGRFVTFAGLTTAMENFCGILEEEQGITSNYLPDHATLGVQRRKITPCFPSTVIRAEYAQADAAGTSNLDTNFTGTAASTTLTAGDGTTATGDMSGGWVYCTNGSNASYLHYIETNDGAGAITLGSALVGAVVAADDLVIIQPPNGYKFDFDATFTGILSEVTAGSLTHAGVLGLETYIQAPGIPFQRLDRAKHDGLKIANARFFHEFTIPGSVALPNAWNKGILQS